MEERLFAIYISKTNKRLKIIIKPYSRIIRDEKWDNTDFPG